MSVDTVTGNKLIAVFDGFHYNKYNQWCKLSDLVILDGEEYAEKWVRELKYHSSWDWLMPVVEKIEAINDLHHGYFGVHISSNNCTIQATNFRPNKPMANPSHYFSDHHGESKIQATWFAIIQFIKWYNQNKSSNK